ncbi:protein C2-DOMAIN ABA-RELATED 1-like [Bidens hawaiensis]|uniref:protein C2-DOMAIN ABA-RELATED 1-like n=1 Tax=Bidens hawaiensis TaxID=980011 RepID=UPI00404A83E8
MEGVIGILKLTVKKGTNLVICDWTRDTSDPYVIATLDHQKTKTTLVKENRNPVWDCDLTMIIKDPKAPITLTVHDKDTLSEDDNMGVAHLNLSPYIEQMEMRNDYQDLEAGTILAKVQPDEHNNFIEESHIIWNKDVITQDMFIRLENAETGEIEVRIEITPVENHRLKLQDEVVEAK